MKTPCIILSGFGPFGRYPANSSEQVAKALNNKKLGGFHVHSRIFPATIPSRNEDRPRILFKMATRLRAEAIIALGMSSSVPGPQVETHAVNKIGGKYCPQADGSPANFLCEANLELIIDIEKWQYDLFERRCGEIGHHVQQSQDAGTFCCNHLIFNMIITTVGQPKRFGKIPWIFLQIPCTPEAVPKPTPLEFQDGRKVTMTVEEIIQCLKILVQVADI